MLRSLADEERNVPLVHEGELAAQETQGGAAVKERSPRSAVVL